MTASNRQSNSPMDLATLLHTGTLAASAVGSAGILDLKGAGKVKGRVVLDVSALEIASNDEIYDIYVQGSPDAAFGTAGNIVELAMVSLSAKEAKRTTSDRDDAAGRRSVYFDNLDEAGTPLRYIRLYVVIAGTIATGITFDAHLVPMDE